jgi:NhaP-type Na+/H+ or K+/H+ antiporter
MNDNEDRSVALPIGLWAQVMKVLRDVVWEGWGPTLRMAFLVVLAVALVLALRWCW